MEAAHRIRRAVYHDARARRAGGSQLRELDSRKAAARRGASREPDARTQATHSLGCGRRWDRGNAQVVHLRGGKQGGRKAVGGSDRKGEVGIAAGRCGERTGESEEIGRRTAVDSNDSRRTPLLEVFADELGACLRLQGEQVLRTVA